MRIFVFCALIFLTACATPQYREEEGVCVNIWLNKLPREYVREWYDKTMTREVPTGVSTCTRTATGFTCKQETKTEHYTVPAARRVDRNADLRDQRIRACTKNRCLRKYSNPLCKTR